MLESAVVLLVANGKDENGSSPFNTSSIVLVVESLKLLVSIISLWHAGRTSVVLPTEGETPPAVTGEENGLAELRRISLLSSLRYGVPGALYAINNNIFLYILTRMSPAVFQLLLNSRVVWTGLAFRWFMGRHLTRRQWIASFSLLFGCVLSQLDSVTDKEGAIVSLAGLALTAFYCAVSVSASVYNELLMKTEPSLHVANIQLYAFGVLFNGVGLLVQGSGADSGSFFAGWSLPSTWIIATFQVVIGLLISRVMKNFDSIMKIFCVACSNLVVYGVSVFLGTQPFTLLFLASFAIVSVSGYRYSTPEA